MIGLISTSDTDLLSAQNANADYSVANPSRTELVELETLARRSDVVIIRVLGGYRAWDHIIDPIVATATPVIVLTGEYTPDADLMSHSTVTVGIATQAHQYLTQGGPRNLTSLAHFLSDTVLMNGDGFEPVIEMPNFGVLERPTSSNDGPVIAVLYYRAQHLAGNTAFIETLCEAIEARGARALPIFCATLRGAEDELIDLLASADALIVTVLAAGGASSATPTAGGDDQAWDVSRLAALNIPILQGLCLTTTRSDWDGNDDGMSPTDVANQVAIPEFDGRIITVPFSFKTFDTDGLPKYVADPERADRVAGIAIRHATLGTTAHRDRRIALLFSAYPTKHARIGNAVGLDTPASALALLNAMAAAGYDIPDTIPGLATGDSDALIHALIDSGGQDPQWLSQDILETNPHRMNLDTYLSMFNKLPSSLREAVTHQWGEAPGELFVDTSTDHRGEIVIAAMEFGNILLMVQPPRGFGDNPVAIYHDPDLPPSHHYLASYFYLQLAQNQGGFGAHAIVHIGKHGNLEWLPGKTVGLSANCGSDAAIGNLPLIYPFLVNDPGEGTQAKRRAHAVIIDHLIPPMARAESYGDIARLEQLLDEHSNIAALDPAKLPAIRQQIWTLLQAAKMDSDLGWESRPDDDVFDDMLMHVDGWLCEIKDVQIRDGLHILGAAPEVDVTVDLVLAMLRATQLWQGSRALPGLRTTLGLTDASSRIDTDHIETVAKDLVNALAKADWNPDSITDIASGYPAETADVLAFAATEIVPRLNQTTREIPQILRALDGGFIEAGPSGSPLRGLTNVLPTGRNFYSIDPKAIPSRLAWETGTRLADSLIDRYRTDHGEYPHNVGISLWGTSAMRTGGDDIAEVLALIGVTPIWDEASRRITSIEVIPTAELGRPRIDVTVRISGFFRDAFPHVVALIDDAITTVAELDEDDDVNYVAAQTRRRYCELGHNPSTNTTHTQTDDDHAHDHTTRWRRATTRIFGSKPGSYGAGLLQLIDAKNWRTDDDLAAVYAAWGGFAYGCNLDGCEATDDMKASYITMSVAVKNTDTREHDIADSDDYFQYHGGMIATVRALTGNDPEAYIGDNTNPDNVRTRTLVEETTRVFRSRVINPRWMEAMRRHGYKGAFEMAATVDYLFGYDATAGVMKDWMYQKLTDEYVLDPQNQAFLTKSNPWALHGMSERLLEAVGRGMWAEPDAATINQLRQVLLKAEGHIER